MTEIEQKIKALQEKQAELETQISAIKREIGALEKQQYMKFCDSLVTKEGNYRIVWEQVLNGELYKVDYGDLRPSNEVVEYLYHWIYEGARDHYGKKVELQEGRAHLPHYKPYSYSGGDVVYIECYVYLQHESEIKVVS